MPKRTLSELYSEEKKQVYIQKKPRCYPEFEILAAYYKGRLARREIARTIFLFYWL